MKKEIEIKLERIRKFLKGNNLNGIILNKVSNFAWFTGGKSNFVGLHTESGASSLLITQKKIYIVANNIEFPRLQKEELKDMKIQNIVLPWYEDGRLNKEVKKIVGGKIGCDNNWEGFVPASIEKLHFPLTGEEILRYKQLGKQSSIIMTNVCKEIKQGESELKVAGKLSNALWENGLIPVVILIAADGRTKNFRHPIPTKKKIKNHVMVVLCAKQHGLIVSLTRLVHFGKIPSDLRKKHRAVSKVNACFISETTPEKSMGDVFLESLKVYRETGYTKEWELHHQGGPTGYLARYFRGDKNTEEKIIENQAFAWNPSITGTKSEDTIITGKFNPAVITEDLNWPMIEIEYKNRKFLCPDILNEHK